MTNPTNKKVLVAMSGGVDSSTAAMLMLKNGWNCTGVTMKLLDSPSSDYRDAEAVCRQLGIPFHLFDFVEEFRSSVITPFVESYEKGETPNPCIDCNRTLKFGALFQKGKELGCEYIATGHYARIERDDRTGRYLLKKAANLAKDQSYFLYQLSQEVLAHTVFPLGDFSDKAEIRETAKLNNLPNAAKHDSQDICFIKDGDYTQFLRQFTGKDYPNGNFIDTDGKIFGRHNGIINYTVGQRKGLGIAWSEPLYVCKKNAADNTVTLGTVNELYCDSLTAHSFNWIAFENPPDKPIEAMARTRCHGKETPVTVTVHSDGTVTVKFSEPQRATSPGQSVVLYDGDIVIGGGIIS